MGLPELTPERRQELDRLGVRRSSAAVMTALPAPHAIKPMGEMGMMGQMGGMSGGTNMHKGEMGCQCHLVVTPPPAAHRALG